MPTAVGVVGVGVGGWVGVAAGVAVGTKRDTLELHAERETQGPLKCLVFVWSFIRPSTLSVVGFAL